MDGLAAAPTTSNPCLLPNLPTSPMQFSACSFQIVSDGQVVIFHLKRPLSNSYLASTWRSRGPEGIHSVDTGTCGASLTDDLIKLRVCCLTRGLRFLPTPTQKSTTALHGRVRHGPVTVPQPEKGPVAEVNTGYRK